MEEEIVCNRWKDLAGDQMCRLSAVTRFVHSISLTGRKGAGRTESTEVNTQAHKVSLMWVQRTACVFTSVGYVRARQAHSTEYISNQHWTQHFFLTANNMFNVNWKYSVECAGVPTGVPLSMLNRHYQTKRKPCRLAPIMGHMSPASTTAPRSFFNNYLLK